ncbi:hypothetical protein [Halosimplex sp. TS25]|uniref:hypothetical protein n=1 Tax=Halosimplex rarum TaxID=3396619 RepID=UPI0039E7C7AD
MRRPKLLQLGTVNFIIITLLLGTFGYSEFAGISMGPGTYVIMQLTALLNVATIVGVAAYVYYDEHVTTRPWEEG